MALVACGGGNGDTTEIPPPPPPAASVPTAISISAEEVNFSALAQTQQLTARVTDANGVTISSPSITWSSSAGDVVSVSNSGLVTAIANGTAMVTATMGNLSDTVEVRVDQVATSLVISPSGVEMSSLFERVQLSAELADANGYALEGDLTPAWTTSNVDVARFDEPGILTSVSNGSTEVTASSGEFSDTIIVHVRQVPASIEIRSNILELSEGEIVDDIVVKVLDANGYEIETATLTWSSSDESIATVESSGTITAIAVGSAVVTVNAGEHSTSISVTVGAKVARHPDDLAALEALYRSTDGDNWINNLNWMSDKPLSDWHGVFVNDGGRVFQVALWSNNLHGSLPSELGLLSELTYLALNNSKLTGRIPSTIGNLTKLEDLVLFFNQLEGPIPTEFGQLTNLRSLELTGNQLSGELPISLSNLVNLEEIGIADNQFIGTLPSELGLLKKLKSISAHKNKFNGPIPTSWSGMSSLTSLSIYRNELSGKIPAEFGNLVQLRELNISINQLTGTIPNSLLNLKLTQFIWFENEGLCIPDTRPFNDWSNTIANHQGEDTCSQRARTALEDLYNATDGANWRENSGWLVAALDDWHGISLNEDGAVEEIDLSNNDLKGELLVDLGDFKHLKILRFDGNPNLSGRLPRTLLKLENLVDFRYDGTSLCLPAGVSFERWVKGIQRHEGTSVGCSPSKDRETLSELFEELDGSGSWKNITNWGSDEPLNSWQGVSTNAQERVTSLDLNYNGLTGFLSPAIGELTELTHLNLAGSKFEGSRIPPEIGNLVKLKSLNLGYSGLGGEIPPELGNLTQLIDIDLSGNQLSGSIPPELGKLENLIILLLGHNDLSGSVPTEISQLTNLGTFFAEGNQLSGSIPQELSQLNLLLQLDLGNNQLTGALPFSSGGFRDLDYVDLGNNQLSGEIPPELAKLRSLKSLFLSHNQLSGTIPAEIGNMSSLESFSVTGNRDLSGVLPSSLSNLKNLQHLHTQGTNLCASNDAHMEAWLSQLIGKTVKDCDASELGAYITQAVQSLELPVTLISNQAGMLRVFPTAAQTNTSRIPSAHAEFFIDDQLIHSESTPSKPGPIPTQVDLSSLDRTINVLVPAEVVQPGLEVVVVIDPENQLDSTLQVPKRVPEEGRQGIKVSNMPSLDIVFIPFVHTKHPDTQVVEVVSEMAADPMNHPMLEMTRTLMPIDQIKVTAYSTVETSSNDANDLLGQVAGIQAIEGGDSYFMGLLSSDPANAAGIAVIGSKISFSVLDEEVIAHELGHNLLLNHAPCGGASGPDPAYPYENANLGAWGFSFANGGTILHKDEVKDLMSYCGPAWISDFSFEKALRYRLHQEGKLGAPVAFEPVPSLLIWGGLEANKTPFLEPAIVVESQVTLPQSDGPYLVRGYSHTGESLFAFSFDISPSFDGDGTTTFAYTVPIEPNWRYELANIEFTGPSGKFVIDSRLNDAVSITRDSGTGQITGFLRGDDVRDSEGFFSRGIPVEEAWSPQ